MEVEVTLAQPAAEGDALLVRGSSPDAGALGFSDTASWKNNDVLRGALTVLHLTSAPELPNFKRRVAVRVLDAGVYTQLSHQAVRMSGTFEPLPSGVDQQVDWDDGSLDALIPHGGSMLANARGRKQSAVPG